MLSYINRIAKMLEKLAILLSRKLSGEASDGELKEFELLIKEYPEYHYFIDSLETYWRNNTHTDFSNISDNIHFQRILERAATAEPDHQNLPAIIEYDPPKRFISVKKLSAMAAMLAGVILCAALIFQSYKKEPVADADKKNTISTALGAKSQILLPDGSKVWLNAGTKLLFDKKFTGRLREVYLEGEAYFDVRKDKSRPFIVHTSDIDIRVLGTAFNVKSYKEEATIEATLIHGSIQVSNKLQPDIPQIILRPNEKLIFRKSGNNNPQEKAVAVPATGKEQPAFLVSKITPVVNDSTLIETSWIHNRLLFEGETFREIATKMERWFDVKIHFASEEAAAYRLRGVFEDETIDEALKALQQIAPFNYSIKDKNITITK